MVAFAYVSGSGGSLDVERPRMVAEGGLDTLLFGRASAVMSLSCTTCSSCSRSTNELKRSRLIGPRGSTRARTLAGAMGDSESRLMVVVASRWRRDRDAAHRLLGRTLGRGGGCIALGGSWVCLTLTHRLSTIRLSNRLALGAVYIESCIVERGLVRL